MCFRLGRLSLLVFAIFSIAALHTQKEPRHQTPLPVTSSITHMEMADGKVKTLHLSESALQALAKQTNNLPTTTGNKKVAVIIIRFQDTPADVSPSKPDIQEAYFGSGNSVASFYKEVSYGKLNLSGDVFGPVTLPMPIGKCDAWEWTTPAFDALKAQGVDLSRYDIKVLFMPGTTACSWGGLGAPGLNWINGLIDVGITSHEMGHALGINHASTYHCHNAQGQAISIGDSTECSKDEYGDVSDVMGAANTHGDNGYHRYELGFLTDMQTISESGTYTLQPLEGMVGPRLLRVIRSDGSYIYLDTRQPSGQYDNFPKGSPITQGVSMRIGSEPHTWQNSILLDATPQSKSTFDAAFLPGTTLVDPIGNDRITVLSSTSKESVISVRVGSSLPLDATLPSTPLKASVKRDGPLITINWEEGAATKAISGYQIYRDENYVTSTTEKTVGLPNITYHWDRSRYQVRSFDSDGNLSEFTDATIQNNPPKKVKKR
jgi:hypothetical protein